MLSRPAESFHKTLYVTKTPMDSKKMREHKDSVIKHCLQHLSCVSNSYSDIVLPITGRVFKDQLMIKKIVKVHEETKPPKNAPTHSLS